MEVENRQVHFDASFFRSLQNTLKCQYPKPQQQQKGLSVLQPTGVFKPQAGDGFTLEYNLMCVDRVNRLSSRFVSRTLKRLSIYEIPGSSGRECYIVGQASQSTRCKQTRNSKYLEVQSLQKKRQEKVQQTSEQDEFMLEDESGKIKVVYSNDFDHKDKNLAVGVIGVRGSFNKASNKFVCTQIMFPVDLPQSYPISSVNSDFYDSASSSQYMLLVAGMKLKTDYANLNYQISSLSLVPRLRGVLDNITSTVIVGGLSAESGLSSESDQSALRESLIELTKFSSVYVMPSFEDELGQSKILPVAPLDTLLFYGVNLNRLNRCSNPQLFTFPHRSNNTTGHLRILGSCGQNVNSLKAQCKFQNDIEAMKHQLRLRHIAPNSPENLKVVPCKQDRFVMQSLPNLYFSAGNQYQTSTYEVEGGQCRMVVVPTFSQGMVLVNLQNLSTVFISLQ